MDLMTLYRQFQKGTIYFSKHWAGGTVTPPVMRQFDDFEKKVIIPFDKICLGATPEEKQMLENVL
jgi:hypothetical protein